MKHRKDKTLIQPETGLWRDRGEQCLMRRLPLICTFHLDDDCFGIHNNFSLKYKYIWLE